jgi:putative transposase
MTQKEQFIRTRDCKYHLVWISKYWRKSLYGDARRYLWGSVQEIIHAKNEQGSQRSPYGIPCADRRLDAAKTCGASDVTGRWSYQEQECQFTWQGHFPDTRGTSRARISGPEGTSCRPIGKDELAVREYIRQQEADNRRLGQLNLFR